MNNELVYQKDVPSEARFVVYQYPGTISSLQRTLLYEGKEAHPTNLPRTWDAIEDGDLSGYAYAVKLKDANNKLLPYTYMLRVEGTVRDLFDVVNAACASSPYDVEADWEQAQASTALSGSDLNTYVKAKIKDDLMCFPFDPETMKIVVCEKK